jgi:hypothetical protein
MSSETEDLNQKLDELLEKYLHLVDQYQKAQANLSKELSSVSEMEINHQLWNRLHSSRFY